MLFGMFIRSYSQNRVKGISDHALSTFDLDDLLVVLIPENYPVVCESGSFATVYKPGLHILIESTNPDDSKESYKSNLNKADLILVPNMFSKSKLNFVVEYVGLQWLVKKKSQLKTGPFQSTL